MPEDGDTVNARQQKYLLLLKTLYDPKAGRQEKESVSKALAELTETEQVEFNDFQHVVGEHFLKIREELDKGLDDLADAFPDESDPRKWDVGDWMRFGMAIEGHKYQELYSTYANQQPNIHLMWAEIESRL